MTILNKYLNNSITQDSPVIIFLYDSIGNLNESDFINSEEKINKKKYKIKFFSTSDLKSFYTFFESNIRHKPIPERLLIILSNNPQIDVNSLNNPPFYTRFLKKKSFCLDFEIKKYLEKNFKIKTAAEKILEKPLNWFINFKAEIMYYRAAKRNARKFDSTILEIKNENAMAFIEYIENFQIEFIQ